MFHVPARCGFDPRTGVTVPPSVPIGLCPLPPAPPPARLFPATEELGPPRGALGYVTRIDSVKKWNHVALNRLCFPLSFLLHCLFLLFIPCLSGPGLLVTRSYLYQHLSIILFMS
ncbi:hypothetical protein NEOLEDRAFT_20529 [Neolentinus lepideus HHB14362 ss-1]|uniref:Uncharacterized protein n=1 Tax=Neolentinus lepideus HHB14362 ss-1 TaxID=1314782 RepID=A0A165W2U8_9AGAM|nr:hypothetical protein NEOLEDRAFT_20529 [Neolentinus lepideus HHB14362 ss-1]